VEAGAASRKEDVEAELRKHAREEEERRGREEERRKRREERMRQFEEEQKRAEEERQRRMEERRKRREERRQREEREELERREREKERREWLLRKQEKERLLEMERELGREQGTAKLTEKRRERELLKRRDTTAVAVDDSELRRMDREIEQLEREMEAELKRERDKELEIRRLNDEIRQMEHEMQLDQQKRESRHTRDGQSSHPAEAVPPPVNEGLSLQHSPNRFFSGPDTHVSVARVWGAVGGPTDESGSITPRSLQRLHDLRFPKVQVRHSSTRAPGSLSTHRAFPLITPRLQALADFSAFDEELELSFKKGDVITFRGGDESGWAQGASPPFSSPSLPLRTTLY
jgi:hypothetical protein